MTDLFSEWFEIWSMDCFSWLMKIVIACQILALRFTTRGLWLGCSWRIPGQWTLPANSSDPVRGSCKVSDQRLSLQEPTCPVAREVLGLSTLLPLWLRPLHLGSGDSSELSNLLKSAHFSHADNNQPFEVLVTAGGKTKVLDEREPPCETWYPGTWELVFHLAPCTQGQGRWGGVTCLLLPAVGAVGGTQRLSARSHLRAVTDSLLSLWKWTVYCILGSVWGEQTLPALCLFCISFQLKITILSAQLDWNAWRTSLQKFNYHGIW